MRELYLVRGMTEVTKTSLSERNIKAKLEEWGWAEQVEGRAYIHRGPEEETTPRRQV